MVLRQTAAELFASCLIEVFPKLQLVSVRSTPFGFLIDCCLPSSLEEASLEIAKERMRGKIKKGIEVRKLEMTTRNAVEYMRHVKQYFREKEIDLDEPFTDVVQIEDYANIAQGDVIVGPVEELVFAIDGVYLVGDIELHGKTVDLQRIIGFAESDKEALKGVKKAAELFQSRGKKDFVVFSDDGYCWMGEALKQKRIIEAEIKKGLEGLGFTEIVVIGGQERSQFGQKVFEECVAATEGYGEFGVKDAPLQGALCGVVKKEVDILNSLLQFLKKLGTISPQNQALEANQILVTQEDSFGIDWVVAEVEEKKFKIEFIMWTDRLVALEIEKLKKEL